MQQAHDFLAECETLAAVLAGMPPEAWEQPTAFKGWTPDNILTHLHFWNRATDLALTAPDEFAAIRQALQHHEDKTGRGNLRGFEDARLAERGDALFRLWQAHYTDMASRWAEADPKARLQWVGPEMSARTAITARQMETWAHGMAICDLLGVARREGDRIRNIVILGINTFGFCHGINGLAPPAALPHLRLTAPSGEVWHLGGEAGTASGSITGAATEFAAVVTQTRNIGDTSLMVEGDAAKQWMAIAQCFAGDAHPPPAPGSRHGAGLIPQHAAG